MDSPALHGNDPIWLWTVPECTLAGYGIAEGLPRRGLLEDARLGLELAVTVVFEAARTAIRALLLLPQRQAAASSQVIATVAEQVQK